MRLHNKVALITGATGGIGSAISRLFAQEGAKVIVAARKADLANKLVDDIRCNGGEAIFMQLEITNVKQWNDVITQIKELYGALHILVNNAATNEKCTMPEVDLDQWNKVMAINVTAPMLGIQSCAPLIKESGGGSIVNISSLGGILGGPSTSYVTSKWAMCGLSRSTAFTFADWGIRSNTICPGFIEGTNMTNAILSSDAKKMGKTIGDYALTGHYGTTRELAQAALFLASDESSYITGVELPVDGGLYSAGIYATMLENKDIFKSK